MQIRNSVTLPTGKDIRTIAHSAESYRPLLTTLALQLGMSKQDCQALVESVVLRAGSRLLLQNNNYTLKAWLTKLLVHDCVFKLSNALFSEGKNCSSLCEPANSIWAYQPGSKLPISTRLIYLLCHVGGFNECEAAQILNSSSAKVRAELAKARHLLTGRC